MQDLNDMLYFAEVVERGGFAAAGRALGIPKSRLSRRVSELESQLGARLLHRTTRKLSLTDVGEAYLRHCQAVRESAEAAADAVAQVQTEPRGTLRVSCPVTIAQSVLGQLMPDFLAQLSPGARGNAGEQPRGQPGGRGRGRGPAGARVGGGQREHGG